jgi:hypothetical protein
MSQLKLASGIDDRAAEIASVINEFWLALKERLPEAFENANDYALFKSGGVGPMNLVLRDLMIKMHQGHRKYTKDEFLAMIEGSDLLGSAEFWQSDNEDGARIYSGKANWPDLAKKIIRDIDEGVRA